MKVTDYTFLGFVFTSLLDNGHAGELIVADVKDSIERRTIFRDLKDRFGDELDISLYDGEKLDEIIDHWQALTEISERRKFGVERDGLCLLVAYCLEGAQHPDRG